MRASAARAISPESISQTGAGLLVLGVGIVELALDFWAAGWWQRGGALLVVAVGAALLARGTTVIVQTVGTPELLRRARPDYQPARAAFRLAGQSRLAE